MTRVYFVRHAQPKHDWKEDRTRPLTEEGKKDSAIVLEFLKDKKIEAFYCSPYKRLKTMNLKKLLKKQKRKKYFLDFQILQ